MTTMHDNTTNPTLPSLLSAGATVAVVVVVAAMFESLMINIK